MIWALAAARLGASPRAPSRYLGPRRAAAPPKLTRRGGAVDHQHGSVVAAATFKFMPAEHDAGGGAEDSEIQVEAIGNHGALWRWPRKKMPMPPMGTCSKSASAMPMYVCLH